MKNYVSLAILAIILCSIGSNVYAHGFHPHPKIKIKVPKVEIIRIEVDVKGDLNNPGKIVDNVVRESKVVETNIKREVDQGIINLKTEWNYFFGTICGESSENKKLTRDYDQREISPEEYEKRKKEIPQSKECGGGVSVSDDGSVTLLDKNGVPSEKPDPTTDNTQDILDWMVKVEIEDWEKEMNDKFVAGVLVPLTMNKGVTWFSKPLGNVTSTNSLRKATNGHPSVGARRVIRDKDGNITGYRLHKGTDYAANPGDPIYAAVSGKLTYRKMSNKPFYIAEITTPSGHIQRTLYVKKPFFTRQGSKKSISAGDEIGKADKLSKYDGYKLVPNHVHVNYISPEGVYIAPNNKFGVTGDSNWIAENCKNKECISSNNLKPLN